MMNALLAVGSMHERDNWQLCEGSLLGCEDTFMSQ